MNEEIKKIIKEKINPNIYSKGESYEHKIQLYNHIISPIGEQFEFKVSEEYTYYYEYVKLVIKNKEIEFMKCSCMDFCRNNQCKHIAQHLLNFQK